jgi:hypothetical protein
MKNNTPNDAIEQVFQQLTSIQKVAPNADLYASIIKAIEKPQMIGWIWVRSVAAILLIFFSLELFLAKKELDNIEATQLKTLVPQTQNTLYNE